MHHGTGLPRGWVLLYDGARTEAETGCGLELGDLRLFESWTNDTGPLYRLTRPRQGHSQISARPTKPTPACRDSSRDGPTRASGRPHSRLPQHPSWRSLPSCASPSTDSPSITTTWSGTSDGPEPRSPPGTPSASSSSDRFSDSPPARSWPDSDRAGS